MPSTITATFEVVTPLFMGGADPARTAELRAPSIKGALRFWWRALAWSRHAADLAAIRDEERRIFGAAGDDRGLAGQSSFLLQVRAERPPPPIGKGVALQGENRETVGPGTRYLGYGLMEAFGARQGQLNRPGLPAPFRFTLRLLSRENLDPSVLDALKLLGLLGGLGSRSRRGYGSLSLSALNGDLDPWAAPGNVNDYRQGLRAVLRPEKLTPPEPTYSAFSGLSRIDICLSGDQPLRLLDQIGRQMQRYRSWGHNGIVNGSPSERNFRDDHDWFKNEREARLPHPKRIAFGLPHNYSKEVGISAEAAAGVELRRASPLFVHVHKLAAQSYLGVITVLRSQFLPADAQLKLSGRRKAHQRPEIDWTVLDRLLDGVPGRQPYFPDRIPVLP